MAWAYAYEAVNGAGRVIRGEIRAPDVEQLIVELAQRDLTLVKLLGSSSTSRVSKAGARVKSIDVAELASYVAVTSRAGLSIIDSLADFAEQTKSEAMREVLGHIVEDVRGGSTMEDAFGKHPRAFDRMFLSMLAAGEQSGALEMAMESTARQIRFQQDVVTQVKAALVQPAILVACVSGLVVLLITYLLPRIVGTLGKAGVELPMTTQLLLDTSHFLTGNWLVIVIGLAFTVFAFRRAMASDGGRRRVGLLIVSLPVVGPMVKLSAQARFVSTMSTLLAAGVDAVSALRMAGATTGSPLLSSQLEQVAEDVSAGATLTEAMAEIKDLHPLVRRMIQLGETSGNLESTLQTAVDYFSQELPRRVKGTVALLEPLIVVCSGVVVAFILLSALLPVFSLYDSL